MGESQETIYSEEEKQGYSQQIYRNLSIPVGDINKFTSRTF